MGKMEIEKRVEALEARVAELTGKKPDVSPEFISKLKIGNVVRIDVRPSAPALPLRPSPWCEHALFFYGVVEEHTVCRDGIQDVTIKGGINLHNFETIPVDKIARVTVFKEA